MMDEKEKLKNKIAIWQESVDTLSKTNFKKALSIRKSQLEELKQELIRLEE